MNLDDTFACPHCDRQFRYKPELEGKQVRCKCGEKFSVKAPQVQEPDPYALDDSGLEDDGPDWSALLESTGDAAKPTKEQLSQKCPSCGSLVVETAAICVHCGTDLRSGQKVGKTTLTPGWAAAHDSTSSAVRTKITGAGLAMHGLGFLLLILGVTVAAIGGGLAASNGSTGEVLVMIGGLAMLGGMPFLIIGPFLGLAAPADAGRGLLIASILFYIGGLVFAIMLEMQAIPQILGVAQSIPFLLGAGCFLGFLQKLSVYLDDDSLYERAEFLLKTFFWIVILTLLMFIPILGCLAAIAALGAQVVFSIVYAWTVCQAALSAIRT